MEGLEILVIGKPGPIEDFGPVAERKGHSVETFIEETPQEILDEIEDVLEDNIRRYVVLEDLGDKSKDAIGAIYRTNPHARCAIVSNRTHADMRYSLPESVNASQLEIFLPGEEQDILNYFTQ